MEIGKEARKTVLITGSSTGIGRATALHFQRKGWNVAATMRSPEKEKELAQLPNMVCPKLDVVDSASVQSAIREVVQKFGSIDVLVNNAGYGLSGPFEGMTESQINRQFETNVFGLMRVIRTVIPHFRAKKSGVIINISSIGGRVAFPFYSVYHATKWAVEGFTESLRFELEPFGIRVKLVEPGAIKTDFYNRSSDSSVLASPADYKDLTDVAFANMNRVGDAGALPEEVAAVIFKAATSTNTKLRYPVGKDAKPMLFFRPFLSDGLFASVVRSQVFKK
jgi:NAD(P)-dependent dehydrogenase (short-subunit alcohol dehydrogenase family)